MCRFEDVISLLEGERNERLRREKKLEERGQGNRCEWTISSLCEECDWYKNTLENYRRALPYLVHFVNECIQLISDAELKDFLKKHFDLDKLMPSHKELDFSLMSTPCKSQLENRFFFENY